ncbi:MAG: LysR family transcriptional regulator [Synergistaceae bacterium]|jgi:DNA-binding transcriptional LysR family regulator|nr:LysR family transcriptional regulator [Synergistaceae bacterium]
MDLKYLTTVKTILETGTFQRAANRLNYTQSTVTFQVRRLERELSLKLFERIGRRMVLTEAGHEILPYVDAVLQSVDRLRNFGKEDQEIRGALKLAMPETLLTYKSQPIQKAFRERAPQVRLLVRSQNCYLTRNQILNGDIDIALHYGVEGYNDMVVTKKLADFGQALVASPALAEDQRDFITPNQRKSVSLISNDKNCISQEIFDQYLRDRKIHIENVIELCSVAAIKHSVISDIGVAFLPYFAVEEELESGRLIELPTNLRQKNISAICAYHKNKWVSPAIELFLRLVDEYIFMPWIRLARQNFAGEPH